MKVFLSAFLLLALSASVSWAAAHQYSTAKIVDVQRKTREKVNMYLVNTPIGTEVPYFELTLIMDKIQYTAEFTPRHEDEELPPEWIAGSDVSARIEKHALYLKRSDGLEFRWTITKHHPVKETK